jgi:ankyrin repeat protein
VRLVNRNIVGPWEQFQSDATKYRQYSAHMLNGRTPEQDFSAKPDAALAKAACVGDLAAIATALKSGANANAKGQDGNTPIFWALDCGNLVGLEALLKAGADTNYKLPGAVYVPGAGWGERKAMRTGQYSPLYAAVRDRNISALKLLLRYGADPNTFKNDREHDTAFDLAVKHDDGSFELMLDADKDLNRADSVGNTLADRLAIEGRPELVEMILKRGYDHNLIDLGATIQNAGNWTNDKTARSRVIALLKAKGVRFPVASRFERWSHVSMQDDGTLTVHWGDLHSRHGVVEPGPDQIIKKDEPLYDQLIARVGGLKPGERKDIEQRPDDVTD